MGLISICLELSNDYSGTLDISELEKNYQKVYKPLITFLYAHPRVNFSFSFSGSQLEFLQQKHPEALQILRELTGRNQIEILGGGYYNPIFPLLFPIDRSGQIEKLTSAIRTNIGKKPRGIALYQSVWDPVLVTTFQSCGMEYVQLESSMIPKNKRNFLPLISHEQCKTIKILTVYPEAVPETAENNESWLSRIIKMFPKKTGENERLNIVIVINQKQAAELLKNKFFDFIDSVISSEKPPVIFQTPQQYLKTAERFIPSYIPAGMSWDLAQWAIKPYTLVENKSHFSLTIHDFVNSYHQSNELYGRMMYLSMMINQVHGDKIRKDAAREMLWKAQFGQAYADSREGIINNAKCRQLAYRYLNEAEKIIRECDEFKESITSFDYNGDGLNEYVCQMNKFNAVVSLKSGCIMELDVFKSLANYSDNLVRVEPFDNVQDTYQRHMFIEHFIEKEEKNSYINNGSITTGIFSQIQFEEKKFEPKRKEIHMEGSGEFSSLQLPVSLTKNILVNSNGLSIQYILKNKGPISLKGIFIVESNFGRTDFTSEKFNQYTTDIIVNGERKNLEVPQHFNTENNVSVFQITDTTNNISFVFEPNEDCSFVCMPISFKRQDEKGNNIETSNTLSTSLYWNVELAAGMEVEKTINLMIVPAKKSKIK